MRSDWTREALDKAHATVRDYLLAQNPIDFSVEESLVKLYVAATVEHTRSADYYELAEVFRTKLEEARRLRA